MSRPPRDPGHDLAAEPYRELEEYLAMEPYRSLGIEPYRSQAVEPYRDPYHDLGKGMFKELVKKAEDKAAERVHHMASGTPKQVTVAVSEIRHLCLDIEKSIQRDVNTGHYDIVFAKKATLDRLFAQLQAQAQAPVQAHYARSFHPHPPPTPPRSGQHRRYFNEY